MRTFFNSYDLTRRLHRASAVVLLLFILPHVANHLVALTGIEAHIAAMRQLRAIYRFAPVEVLLLAAALLHPLAGLVSAFALRVPLDGTDVARRWTQVKAIYAAAWLIAIAWIWLTGASAGLLLSIAAATSLP